MYGNQLPKSGVLPGHPAAGPWETSCAGFERRVLLRRVPLEAGGNMGRSEFNEPGSFGQQFLQKQGRSVTDGESCFRPLPGVSAAPSSPCRVFPSL